MYVLKLNQREMAIVLGVLRMSNVDDLNEFAYDGKGVTVEPFAPMTPFLEAELLEVINEVMKPPE